MSNQVTSTIVNAVEIDAHPGFEIEVKFPHRIINTEELEYLTLIKISKGIIVKLPNETKEFFNVIVAKQFLKFEEGDKIEFKDGDKFNYDVDNLNIAKSVKPKRPGESVDLNDKFLFDDISRKDYQIPNDVDKNLLISDMQRTMIFTFEPFIFYLKSLGNSEIKL